MRQQVDVVVVGGGVVGLTSALGMLQSGFSVAIIDNGTMAVDTTLIDPRVYAINQASQDLLQELGVWGYLDPARLSPYQKMYVWDAKSGGHIEFDARMVISDRLGTIIEESVLKQALLNALSLVKTGLTICANHTVTAINPGNNGVVVTDDKSSWQAQLVMIADGGNSPCRQLLKVPVTSWPYHQHALVALISTEKPHQQTAYQVFNADGPLAFLPLADEKQCSIVWSTTANRAKQLLALDEQAFNQELTKAFAGKLGQVALQGKRYQFPLTMRHVKQYSGMSWLILGDAAHTIHPLAGLGLNVGLADLATWLCCLKQHNNSLLSQSALGSYQRQRKHAVWQIVALMDGLKTLFNNPLLPVATLRGWGLRLCNGLAPLKKIIIEQAAGKKIS